MKKCLLLPLFIIAIATFNGCLSSEESSTTENSDQMEVIQLKDEIRDQKKSEDENFNYSTISTVEFNLDLKDEESNPVDGALVVLTNEKDEVICVSKSSEGDVDFNATLSNVDKIAKVKIQHKSYKERVIEIENIDQYLAIDRTLYMANVIKDQIIDDPGLTDEYTDDNHKIFAHKKFIVAYEDLYPVVGDADFNDTVALLDMTVYTEKTMRYVNKVVIKTTILAAASGMDQGLYINIFGKRISKTDHKLGVNLVDEVHQVLTDHRARLHYNALLPGTHGYNSFYKPEPIVTEIDFDPVVCTLHFPPMPFDPYLVPENEHNIDDLVDEETGIHLRDEVHLPMVETPYTKKRVGGAEEGMVLMENGSELTFENFPWALVFPVDEFDGQKAWQWPLETWGARDLNNPSKATIFKAYPFFKDWYLSKGEECPGWYLLPDEEEKWIYTENTW